MIVRTEAIVLRRLKYGETSSIVTLFTREHGKIGVLAKGARLTGSRFGGTLQPMLHTQVVYYYKPSRGLQMLSESAHISVYGRLDRDLERIETGLRIVELAHALLQDQEQNPSVFNLMRDVLYMLDLADERYRNLLPFFQLRLASILGFAPDIDRDNVASLGAEGGLLVHDSGAILPPVGIPARVTHASRAALRAFAILARSDLAVVMRMNLDEATYGEVLSLTEDYLRTHFGEEYPTRALRVFNQFDPAIKYQPEINPDT